MNRYYVNYLFTYTRLLMASLDPVTISKSINCVTKRRYHTSTDDLDTHNLAKLIINTNVFMSKKLTNQFRPKQCIRKSRFVDVDILFITLTKQ